MRWTSSVELRRRRAVFGLCGWPVCGRSLGISLEPSPADVAGCGDEAMTDPPPCAAAPRRVVSLFEFASERIEDWMVVAAYSPRAGPRSAGCFPEVLAELAYRTDRARRGGATVGHRLRRPSVVVWRQWWSSCVCVRRRPSVVRPS